MPKHVLLLDADQFAYRCAFAAECNVAWEEEHVVSKYCDLDILHQAIEGMVDKARKDTGLSLVYFGMSGDENFRYKVWPDYKGNRDPNKKPIGLKSALAYIESRYPTLKHDKLEADDILGVYAHKWKTSVLWANDKDFLTVPCSLFRNGEHVTITEEMADRNLMIQTMTGDTVDNFKGIEGIGPKKAEKYLEAKGYSWFYVADAFLENGHDLNYFTRMAKLARICRKVSDKDRWFPLSKEHMTKESTTNTEEF